MSGLRARIAGRIVREGPLDWERYVEAALYDDPDGFYARGARLGQGGAFATAPTAHPAFADAVAAEARATWERLGRPAPFAVVEAGPGDGTLAAGLAARLADLPLELVLVERAAGMRALQAERLRGLPVRWAQEPAAVTPVEGLLVANELLDALPFRLLAWPDELLVGVDADGRLVEHRRPADAALRALLGDVAPRAGGRYAVRPGLPAAVTALAGAVRRGRVLLVDYGGEPAEIHDGRRDPVRTYVGGQPGGDPLAAPGRQDITADVDFLAVRTALRGAGLVDVEVIPQADWLAGHGATLPPPAARDDAAWRLAGLLDRRLPFLVAAASRP